MNPVASVAPSMPAAAAPQDLEARAWAVLAAVQDPEIPVLSVVDLGVIRHVHADAQGKLEVGLAPTYSGCPATEVIRASVLEALREALIFDVAVVEVLSPPWTSDWISDRGRERLEHYGIAPPARSVGSPRELWRVEPARRCPRCGSDATCEVSRFGSTPCKALHRCNECLEPFEYFKCI